jgi:hypothetical protein
MIDMAHAWSHGTYGDIKYYLQRLVTFREKCGVPAPLNTPLVHSPASPIIPILLTVSDYTLQQSKRTKKQHHLQLCQSLTVGIRRFQQLAPGFDAPIHHVQIP